MSTAGVVRVALAERQPVMRSALRTLLSAVDELAVVASVDDETDLVRTLASHQPDVVILDVGREVTIGAVLRSVPGVAVVVFTASEDAASLCSALRAGARGYLPRNTEPASIVQAVRGVAAGSVILGPSFAAKLSELLSATSSRDMYPFPDLAGREREVLELIAAGLNNAAVARHLNLAPKTVRNYISSIFTKLRVADRSEAIVRARTAGLVAKNA
jgi:DNA-binding NarL/FixJ family response regulator